MNVTTTANFGLSQTDQVSSVNTGNTTTVGLVTKGASTWAVGQARICLNAGAIASTAAMTQGYVNLPTTGFKAMIVATNVGAGGNMTGYIRAVRYWPRVLTDSEMRQVTT
jgi:hypothetical protein